MNRECAQRLVEFQSWSVKICRQVHECSRAKTAAKTAMPACQRFDAGDPFARKLIGWILFFTAIGSDGLAA